MKNTGDGPFAPDGSPVELYRILPPSGEPELIHAAIPPGCTVLELGCGAGRVTHQLVALGHRAVAVDNSPQMLAHVRGAETVCADIADLRLGRTFGAVVLGSHLVNVPIRAERRLLLDTCARHVEAEGVVLIQRLCPAAGWRPGARFEGRVGEVFISTLVLGVEGSVVSAATTYECRGRSWLQEYRSEILDDASLVDALSASRLALSRWLDPARHWLGAGLSRLRSP